MKEIKVGVIRGDGIGPEVIGESLKILNVLNEQTDYKFVFIETPMGGNVWKKYGDSLPDKIFDTMKSCDVLLFGAVGLPDIPPGVAENSVLKVRQGFDQFINLRPAKLYEPLRDKCPLKEEYIQKGIDLTIIRENTESIYAKIGGIVHGDCATNTMIYTKRGVDRIIKFAFEYAKRKNQTEIISVDKANLLACSQFWRDSFHNIGKKYPKIKKIDFYVDTFVQWLIRKPYTVQTVVTENMFGDIISDETAYLIGSLGMAPSGNINPDGLSMYEPIHGSAPDIAGQDIANPIGSILSLKLMLEETFNDSVYGVLIENAIISALSKGRTLDIISSSQSKESIPKLSTKQMGDLIASELKKLLKK